MARAGVSVTLTYGSLCTGYGGIELGLSMLTDLDVRWQAENDAHASKILDARFPDVPNHGDLTTVDWTQVEPVDVISAGYPCQPFSHAGKRKGTSDERHLWPAIRDAVSAVRPRYVFLENVTGHVTLGFADVLADLATLRYDATWCVVRASDAGAPHGRARLFALATDTRSEVVRFGAGLRESVTAGLRRGRPDNGCPSTPVADAGSSRLREHARESSPQEAGSHEGDELAGHGPRGVATHAAGHGRDEGRTESARLIRGLDVAERGDAPDDTERVRRDGRPRGQGRRSQRRTTAERGSPSGVEWGAYAAAINRWERITGRVAPVPTELATKGGQRLSPAFVEWLMGLPLGWVTDIDISRNEKLKALGNGCVPQQVALAVRTLLQLEARECAA